MAEPAPGPRSDRRPPRLRPRRGIFVGTAAIPSLVTLGNGLAGFAAIHFATKPLPPQIIADGEAAATAWVAKNLVIAAWLLFLGMVCDALDGSLARMTRRTSEFGEQLDSLCDAISFGVAPAILMLRAVQGVLFPYVGEVDVGPQAALAGRAVWFIAALYACCAILRLARFNVETTADISAHMSFKGLPSPPAALSVVSLVLLHAHVPHLDASGWMADWMTPLLVWMMPVVTLAAGLLMVSRVRYPHLINQYLQGRRSFAYIVRVMIVALAAAVIIDFQIALASMAMIYMLSGPVMLLWRKARGKPYPPDAPAETPPADPADEPDPE